MGVTPTKHEVISMLTKLYTHIKYISLGGYHPAVFIMLRFIDQIRTFGQNMCCREVKIYTIFRVTCRTLLSNAKHFQNDFDNKRSVRIKHISLQRNYETDAGNQHTDFGK